jgi:type VI secretion system secreted protein VgrG
MVMLSSTLRGRVVKYHNPALKPNTLLVVSFQGHEAISRPYRYEIDFVSQDAGIDPHAVLTTPGFLGMKQGVAISGGGRGIQTLKIHGLLSTFEQSGKALDWVTYRGVLVPRLWTLSLNVQSRIFLDRTVPQIVEDVLKAAGFASDDYDMRANGRTYPKREYVVQYQESDLDFISRLMEHEGISYYFEQGDEKEKVVFADAPAGFVPMPGTSTFRYQPAGAGAVGSGDWFEEEVVRSLVARDRLLQKEVVLRDYNYRTPSVDLKVQEPAVEKGQGTFYEYGDHYKTADEGKAYAKVRAEEIKCRQKTFTAGGELRGAHAGLQFTLTDHYRAEFSTTYLITDVRTKLTQAIDLTARQGQTRATYQNEFDCIFADTPFRPARLTPKPKIVGTINAKVDAAGDGKYAEIDDQGRYKVILPFDLSGRKDGKATRFIRMAQPYAGPNEGFHFPLHKGADVILTHIDGDPDRPLIAAAVPNPETASPVTGSNQTTSVIHTGGNNKITIEDTDGRQQFKFECPTEGSIFTIGAGNSPAGFNMGSAANMNVELGANDLLKAAGDQLAQIAGNIAHSSGGNHSTTVGGSKSIVVAGSNKRTVGGSDSATVGGSASMKAGGARGVTSGASISHKAAASHNIKAGASVSSKSGAATNIKAGASVNIQAGASVNAKAGASANVKSGGPTNIKAGGPVNIKSGGPTNIKAGGPCNIKGAVNNITGPTNVKGATKIKGATDIKGATKIKGATDIKGATKIKGTTNINGTLKVKGSTFMVS